jgi:hypothetical protein
MNEMLFYFKFDILKNNKMKCRYYCIKNELNFRDRNPFQNLGFQGTGSGTLFRNLGFQKPVLEPFLQI